MRMKIRAFWDIALCSFVGTHRHFRGAYCLHHKGDHPTRLHGAIFQKARILTHNYVATCNLQDIKFFLIFSYGFIIAHIHILSECHNAMINILLCAWDVMGWNLAPQADYHYWGFNGFLPCLKKTIQVVPYIREVHFLPHCLQFIIHNHPVIK
jgi:hypothetical protein